MVEAIFAVVIERDEDGYYIASVPELPGCHTQARSLDDLMSRIKEAVELYIEVEKGVMKAKSEFVGLQLLEVTVR